MTTEQESETTGDNGIKVLTDQYIQALGGSDNIAEVDNCITRLRLSVQNSAIVDKDKLKRLGAAGVVPVGKNGIQVIIGLGKVDKVAEQMKVALAR